jgi:nicotinate-nucleotide adenylyltransferase
VLLVPAHTSPFKARGRDGGRDPGPQHRLRMCELAVARESALEVCSLEIRRGGVSYTVDTLSSLHASHPHAQLTLLLGADTAGTLRSWREPERLLSLARIAVAARAGAPSPAPLSELERRARVRLLQMPVVDVSSSAVRKRVAAGQPVRELVGDAVADYIAEHHLYRAASAVNA